MCGRFNLIDSPEVQFLFETLGMPIYPGPRREDIAPGSVVPIIHEVNGERRVSEAIWWLLLDGKTLKPNYKYASFNSRSDKLDQKRAAAYRPYRESRCIIPASAFIEGLGDKKTYHKVELEDSAIAFGGLFKEWTDRDTGELVYSCSIITLGPLLPHWEQIHPKSFPLMLPFEDRELVDRWLARDFDEVETFSPLLEPRIRQAQIITPVDRPSNWQPIADSFLIVPGQAAASISA